MIVAARANARAALFWGKNGQKESRPLQGDTRGAAMNNNDCYITSVIILKTGKTSAKWAKGHKKNAVPKGRRSA